MGQSHPRASFVSRAGQHQQGREGALVETDPTNDTPQGSVGENSVDVGPAATHDHDGIRWPHIGDAGHSDIEQVREGREGRDDKQSECNQSEPSEASHPRPRLAYSPGRLSEVRDPR